MRNLLRTRAYQRARAIAVYFGIDGEIDLSSVIEHARSSGKSVYAPVLARNGLRFVEIGNRKLLRRNRFGIPEPENGGRIDPRRLDIVLTPLVAFDARGNRLGMGKGYYDRTLQGLRATDPAVLAIGVAFALQEVERVPTGAYDQTLDMVITEQAVLKPMMV